MKERVILLVASKLNDSSGRRLDLNGLVSSFDITVLYVGMLLNRESVTPSKVPPNVKYFEIQAWGELFQLISEPGVRAVIEFGCEGQLSNRVVRACKSLGLLSVQIRDGAQPNAHLTRRIISRFRDHSLARGSRVGAVSSVIQDKARISSLEVLGEYLVGVASQFWGLACARPDLCFFSGSKSLSLPSRFAKVKVPLSSVDLENFYSKPSARKSGYLVFIDEEVAESDAVDYVTLGLQPGVDRDTYYKWLLEKLDEISICWGMPVTIALRPHSDHERRRMLQKSFGRFKVFKGESMDALRNCSGVIFHRSTLSLVSLEARVTPIPLEIDLPGFALRNSQTRSISRALGISSTSSVRNCFGAKSGEASEMTRLQKRDRVRRDFLGDPNHNREGRISGILREVLGVES